MTSESLSARIDRRAAAYAELPVFRAVRADRVTDQRELTIDDCFRLEYLETRIQMARLLAVFHDASPTERLVALCALETAGTITLGTLFAYVQRHHLDHVLYLGAPHVNIEQHQVEGLRERLGVTLDGSDPALLAIADTIFDALGCMFARGAARHWPDLVEAA